MKEPINYLIKIEELKAQGVIKDGEIYDLLIRHDQWCQQINNQGFCNCNPDISNNVTGRVYAEAENGNYS